MGEWSSFEEWPRNAKSGYVHQLVVRRETVRTGERKRTFSVCISQVMDM